MLVDRIFRPWKGHLLSLCISDVDIWRPPPPASPFIAFHLSPSFFGCYLGSMPVIFFHQNQNIFVYVMLFMPVKRHLWQMDLKDLSAIESFVPFLIMMSMSFIQ